MTTLRVLNQRLVYWVILCLVTTTGVTASTQDRYTKPSPLHGDVQLILLSSTTADLTLVRDTNAASTQLRLLFHLVGAREQARGGDYFIWPRIYVEDLDAGALVSVVEGQRRRAASNEQRIEEEITIDSDKLELAPGSYGLRPILLFAHADELDTDIEALFEAHLEAGAASFRLTIGQLEPIDVVTTDPDQVKLYETLIASGEADKVWKGTSALVAYHRLRRQPDKAFAAAERARRLATQVKGLEDMAAMFTAWQVDDLVAQGAYDRAARVLQSLAKTSRRTGFFGDSLARYAALQEALIWRGRGDTSREIRAYSDFLNNHPDLDDGHVVRLRRARAHIANDEERSARVDLNLIARAIKACKKATAMQRKQLICPGDETAAKVDDLLMVLDSDRGWLRERPQVLARELINAFNDEDIEKLDALGRSPDFSFGRPGAHTVRTSWQGPVREYFRSVLKDERFRAELGDFDEAARSAHILVSDHQAGPGNPSRIALRLSRKEFGWRWDGIGGIDHNIPTIPDIPPIDPPPRPPVPLPTEITPRLEAPWKNNKWMRAGGMSGSFDSLLSNPISDVLQSLVEFDRCGSGVPGLFYGSEPTHTGVDHFAIDFVQGATALCTPSWAGPFGDKCVPNVAKALAEYLEAVAKLPSGINSPVSIYAAAYRDPVHAAHGGIVAFRDFSESDGSKNGVNRVDIVGWAVPPVSPFPLAEQFALRAKGGTRNEQVVNAINAMKPTPHFWTKYLHFAGDDCSRGGCPVSPGMWVDKGQFIGRIDDTGEKSFMSHLHFVSYVRDRTLTRTTVADWSSHQPAFHNDFIANNENGKCLKSRNKRDSDMDDDKVPNWMDNCMRFPNRNQNDTDLDGVGDACDRDRDNDGILNDADSCPNSFDWAGLKDIDGDGVNDWTIDIDGDGTNNSCDTDVDGDGILNSMDICPFGADNEDLDGDGTPDWCDFDADGDGVDILGTGPSPIAGCPAQIDEFPFDATKAGDHDGDGVDDLDDPCPCSDVNPVCIPSRPITDFHGLERVVMGLE